MLFVDLFPEFVVEFRVVRGAPNCTDFERHAVGRHHGSLERRMTGLIQRCSLAGEQERRAARGAGHKTQRKPHDLPAERMKMAHEKR